MAMEAYAAYASRVAPEIDFSVEYELLDSRRLTPRAGEVDDWVRMVKSGQHVIPFDRSNGLLKPKFALWGQDGYPSKESFHEIPEDYARGKAADVTSDTLDAGGYYYCGDYYCDYGEDCSSCPYDCGYCDLDAGTPDAGTPDAGMADAGTPDSGTADAGTPDSGTADAGMADAGTPDAGTPDSGTADAGTPDSGTPDAGTCSDASTCSPDAGDCDCPDCAYYEDDVTSGSGTSTSSAFNLLMPPERELADVGPASLAELWRVRVRIGEETREHYAMTIHHEDLVVIVDDTLLAVNLYTPVAGPNSTSISRQAITVSSEWETTIRADGCERHQRTLEDPGIQESRYVTILLFHYDDAHVRARVDVDIECEKVTDEDGNDICRALNCDVTKLSGSEGCDSLARWCIASPHYCGSGSETYCKKTATNDGFDLAAGQRNVHSTNSTISVSAELTGDVGNVGVSFTDNGGTLHAAEVTLNGVRGCSMPQ